MKLGGVQLYLNDRYLVAASGSNGPIPAVRLAPKRPLAAGSSSVRDNLFGVECVLLGDRDWTP